MPTDPFVSDVADRRPRNEPNLAAGVTLPPARGWRADRPGDLHDGIQPAGALFGSPGPNVGYALHLVRRVSSDFALGAHEHLADVEAMVAALAMKRAASFGRAPITTDVECAAMLLGYRGTGAADFVEWRGLAIEGANHEYGTRQTLCDAVPLEVLRLAPSALVAQVTAVQAAMTGSRSAAR